MEEQIKQAVLLREEKKYQASLDMLLEIDKAVQSEGAYMAEHARLLYECGSAYDCLGNEQAAIPYYIKAIELDLEDEYLKQVYVQLGSSYRCIGQYEAAEPTLAQGAEKFPEDQAIKVFLAMTHYNLGKNKDAVAALLHVICDSSHCSEIKRFNRAIKFYAENLDQVWK